MADYYFSRMTEQQREKLLATLRECVGGWTVLTGYDKRRGNALVRVKLLTRTRVGDRYQVIQAGREALEKYGGDNERGRP